MPAVILLRRNYYFVIHPSLAAGAGTAAGGVTICYSS